MLVLQQQGPISALAHREALYSDCFAGLQRQVQGEEAMHRRPATLTDFRAQCAHGGSDSCIQPLLRVGEEEHD